MIAAPTPWTQLVRRVAVCAIAAMVMQQCFKEGRGILLRHRDHCEGGAVLHQPRITQVQPTVRGKGFDHKQRLHLNKLDNHFLHNGLVYRVHRGQELLCVPDVSIISDESTKLRWKVYGEFHDNMLPGHMGWNQTYVQLARRFYWHGMAKDVRKFTAACEKCQMNKKNRRRPQGPLCTATVHTHLTWTVLFNRLCHEFAYCDRGQI
eukprot:SAG11_NODE_1693_length_4437_cov_46.960120_3_plen_206_part_00